MSGIRLLLDDHRGVYIPRDFIDSINLDKWSGIDPEDAAVLRDPEHEHYWETWDSVLSNATFTDENGKVWHLNQEGALFAYCPELMTLSEKLDHGYDIDNDLDEILDANPEFRVVDVTGADESIFNKFVWRGEAQSKKAFRTWQEAAIDCIEQNDLHASTPCEHTLPLFPVN